MAHVAQDELELGCSCCLERVDEQVEQVVDAQARVEARERQGLVGQRLEVGEAREREHASFNDRRRFTALDVILFSTQANVSASSIRLRSDLGLEVDDRQATAKY